MSESKKKFKPRLRDTEFSEKIATSIWHETPSQSNPYVAEEIRCHGYDLMELLNHRSYIEILYLLFSGELPTNDQSSLLEALMIALINPGPRNPATRASITSSVSKTNPAHLLPISLSILGGSFLGGEEVVNSMRFLKKNLKYNPKRIANELLEKSVVSDGDQHVAPGFGSYYGNIDIMSEKIANHIIKLPGRGKAIEWGSIFCSMLNAQEMGWLPTGIAASVLLDLGFRPRAGAGLYQMISAPGLLAHGLEFSNKPITSIPFIKNENYHIENK